MKGITQKMVVLAVGAIVVMLIASCQESATGGPTDAKQSRVIAAENMGLRKELEGCRKQIERLKDLHSKELKRQEELLAKCEEEKGLLAKKADENIKEQVGDVSAVLLEENTKLREENENLKAQVEKLKADLAGKQ